MYCHSDEEDDPGNREAGEQSNDSGEGSGYDQRQTHPVQRPKHILRIERAYV